MENKSPELAVAIKAALAAGEIIARYFETTILREFKEDQSITTLADKEGEQVIKKIILETFPSHSILGEEMGHTDNSSSYTWHIDPLDGTRNFTNGLPFFAVSIALEHKNELIVGVVYNPVTQALFYAEKNRGAYLNDKRIFVSKDDISRGVLTVARGRIESDRKLLGDLMHDLPRKLLGLTTRDIGCSALDLAYISRGGIEVNISLGLITYDFAAGVLLVQEAGGKITKLDGTPWKFPGNEFIASNGVFHDILIAEIKRQKGKLEKNG